MNLHVISAIFRRNFISYFSNPTGYVFICLFTFLSGLAAFWPDEFWNANLANLDQLNRWFPFIMLVFIPAITMSMWAEERRQGTDELLLTIPATDFDVVLGKFLSAVFIFTVGLLFSWICNLIVLVTLGKPDVGQFVATYVGYWFVGVMMLSVGMAASFLTSNLTVSFVLGALFNAPLVFLVWSDSIVKDSQIAHAVKQWSIRERFMDFGRGVISLSSLAYFIGFTAMMLYFSMVLIGRRHWSGGRDGKSLLGHFLIRAAAVTAGVIGLTYFFSEHDAVRADVSSEKLSSLSPETVLLIKGLKTERPVRIDAYVSDAADTPESYVATRLNLLSTLREFEALKSDKLLVTIHNVQQFDDESARAERQFGIKPESVPTKFRGMNKSQDVMLGMAFRCGLQTVKVPFVGKTLPVEYEIVRSIASVTEQKRKRLGLVTTDARLTSMPGVLSAREEMERQYEVVEVDANQPIATDFDVLMVAQPSALSPPAWDNFVAAVKSGMPTLIYEDPLPMPGWWGTVVGTSQPKQAPQMNMFGGGGAPPQPKGNIKALWDLLEVDYCRDEVPTGRRAAKGVDTTQHYDGDLVVWHNYKPFPKLDLPHEWVFAGVGTQVSNSFNPDDRISSGLQNVLLPFPGALSPRTSAKNTEFTALVMTGTDTGSISANDCMEPRNPFMQGPPQFNPRMADSEIPNQRGKSYVLAARIRGKQAAAEKKPAAKLPDSKSTAPKMPDPKMSDKDFVQLAAADGENKPTDKTADKAKTDVEPSPPKERPLHVVLVADVDMIGTPFFNVRNTGLGDPDDSYGEFNVDNVTFMLNALDELSGENRFLEIRKRRRAYRSLELIDKVVQAGAQDIAKIRDQTQNELKDKVKAEEDQISKLEDDLSKKAQEKEDELRAKVIEIQSVEKNAGGESPERAKKIKEFKEQQARAEEEIEKMVQERNIALTDARSRIVTTRDRLEKEGRRKVSVADREQALSTRAVQDRCKLWSVALPPILPLLLAVFVFFARRAGEREGVSKSRLV